MNWTALLLISSVFVLGGCLQNEAQRIEKASAPTDEQAPLETATNANSFPPDVQFEASDLKAKFHTSSSNGDIQQASAPEQEEKQGTEETAVTSATGAVTSTNLKVFSPESKGADSPTEKTPNLAGANAAPEAIAAQAFDVMNSKAYTDYVVPLLKKIRSLRPSSADAFEQAFKTTPIMPTEQTLAAALESSKTNLLVTGYKIPTNSDSQLLHLKDKVLVSNSYFQATTPDKQAYILLEAVLLRMAFSAAPAKDLPTFNNLSALAPMAAKSLLNGRGSLNSRLLYENLNYMQISTADWKFESLDAISTSTEILRLSLKTFKYVAVNSPEEFASLDLDEASPTCTLNFTYHGIENGTRITVSKPEWREFEVNLNFAKGPKAYELKDSAAGEQYLDLEVFDKKSDDGIYRFTLRYLKSGNAGTAKRIPDYVVLEKLSVKGKSEKLLMCRLIPDNSPATN